MIKRIYIRSFEIGLVFIHKELSHTLNPGKHWVISTPNTAVEVVSKRNPWFEHEQLDVIAKSGTLDAFTELIELSNTQAAAVWVDGLIDRVIGPGRYMVWTDTCDIEVRKFDIQDRQLNDPEAAQLFAAPGAGRFLSEYTVPHGSAGMLYADGVLEQTLTPGRYFFWKDAAVFNLYIADLREAVLEISGQEIMTKDKVTLRMNMSATYRIKEPEKAFEISSDAPQALYRDVQLALRAIVGKQALDDILADKDMLGSTIEQMVAVSAKAYGIALTRIGVRDIILPGDMKNLMNQVIEAEKAAKANLIRRREETAAMRSQANTAKLLENNPVLMRMKELDVLESVAKTAKLNIVLGDKGLGERIVNLI